MESGTSSISSPRPTDADAVGPVSVPSHSALAELLDRYAPLRPAPLCPEVQAFQAWGLVEVWEAAERLADRPLPAPFWAYAWAGGVALARVLLNRPDLVTDARVLDLGAGGGITSLAAARAGAADVVANDVDPWALATARLAADRQELELTPLLADLTCTETLPPCDLLLCGDLSYERRVAPRLRALLDRARRQGATVLAGDAGRRYFDSHGLRELASWTLPVSRDLEGVDTRTARVFEWP